jgi:Tol biopolymer transport system component
VTQQYEIHLVDPGSNTDQGVGKPGYYGYAVLSPDGKNVAYLDYASGKAAEVYVLNLATQTVTRVTNTGIRQNYNVQWLDNSRLLYRSYRTGNFGAQLYVADIRGTYEQLLSTAYDICVHDPRVSEDGSRIILYYHSTVSKHAIGSVNVDGTHFQTLNQITGNSPALSKDNSHFYYSDYSAPTPQIGLANLDGTQSALLTSTNSNYDPVPVGDRVLYIRADGSGNSDVYSMKPDGTSSTRVTSNGSNSFVGAAAGIVTP